MWGDVNGAEIINKIHLNECIVPQIFSFKGDSIYVFETINPDESRFVKIKDNKMYVIYETSGQQGIILNDGSMMAISPSEETKVTIISEDGQIKRNISLNGLFFDFKQTSTGKYVCLGIDNGKSLIRIITSEGIKIIDLYLSNMLFASCIYLNDDYIYVGGFDENNIFKISVMNYAGIITSSWEISSASNNRIISKIQKYNDILFIAITGDKDCLGILNLSNGKYKEVSPLDLKIRCIIDICVNNEKVNILDGEFIYEYKTEDIVNLNYKRKINFNSSNMNIFPYAYLMYLHGIEEGLKKYSLCFSLELFILIILYFTNFKFNTKTGLLFLSLIFLCNIIIFVGINIKLFFDRENRVEYLIKTIFADENHSLYIPQIFVSAIIPFLYVVIAYPKFNLTYFLLYFIISFAAFFAVGGKCKADVKKNKDVIVELLTIEDDKINDYVKTSLEKIRDKKIEKMCMKVIFSSNINENYIKKWADSRKYILNNDINYNLSGKYIMLNFDFSKRDIRYSRCAILTDCIGFLNRYFNIKEIIIYPNDGNIL